MKQALAFIVLAALVSTAIWRDMQFLSIVGAVGLLAVIYKTRASQLLNLICNLLLTAREAKVGNMALQLQESEKPHAALLTQHATWAKLLALDLTTEEISLLIAISKEDKFPIRETTRDCARVLSRRGLIEHQQDNIADAPEVWLTSIGKDLARALSA